MRTFIRALIVGGIEVPVESVLELAYTYESLERSTIHLMADSSTRKQVLEGTQNRIKVTITGDGLIPAGIQNISYQGPVLVQCSGHRGITSASNVITLPAARRSDTGSEPYGRAYVGREWISTPVSLNGDVATLTAVPGATMYQAVYFPEILANIENGGPVEQRGRGNKSSWSMTCWEA